jgi:hypothetical protein
VAAKQRVWQRQHPLSEWAFGQHLIGQQRGRLGHAPRATRGTEPALLAAERHEILGVALLAAHTQETLLQPAAIEVGLELLLHVARQRPSGLGAQLAKGGVVLLDKPAWLAVPVCYVVLQVLRCIP